VLRPHVEEEVDDDEEFDDDAQRAISGCAA
jgi:hypothetical protein